MVVVMELKLGNILTLKKRHPCGGWQWEVVRVGADIGIRCLGCQRRVLIDRFVLARRVRKVERAAKGERGSRSVDTT